MRAIAVVIVAALCGSCAWRDTPRDGSATEAGSAVVLHPIDGDTIEVRVAGSVERVRLIGIDTPESVARDRPVECFGPEAKTRTAELLPEGTEVRLERDIEARDRYDRLLAYVFRASDGAFINLLLVEEGFAEADAFAPNVTRQAELDRAESAARAAERGLWPVCGGTDLPTGAPPG
ncbi:MAG: thermonuclease family protein [Actinomycetota bacterium]